VSRSRYSASIYEGREGSGVLSVLHPLYKAFVFFLKVCAAYSCTVLLLGDSTWDAAIQAVKLNTGPPCAVFYVITFTPFFDV